MYKSNLKNINITFNELDYENATVYNNNVQSNRTNFSSNTSGELICYIYGYKSNPTTINGKTIVRISDNCSNVFYLHSQIPINQSIIINNVIPLAFIPYKYPCSNDEYDYVNCEEINPDNQTKNYTFQKDGIILFPPSAGYNNPPIIKRNNKNIKIDYNYINNENAAQPLSMVSTLSGKTTYFGGFKPIEVYKNDIINTSRDFNNSNHSYNYFSGLFVPYK